MIPYFLILATINVLQAEINITKGSPTPTIEMIAAVTPAPEIHIVMRIFGIYLEPGIDGRFQLDDIIDAI
jgi:hypothetical protein